MEIADDMHIEEIVTHIVRSKRDIDPQRFKSQDAFTKIELPPIGFRGPLFP